jgi:hypothetical protein
MAVAKAGSKPREIKYELSLAVWIPGVKLPFRLRVTTKDLKRLIHQVKSFRKQIRNSGNQEPTR